MVCIHVILVLSVLLLLVSTGLFMIFHQWSYYVSQLLLVVSPIVVVTFRLLLVWVASLLMVSQIFWLSLLLLFAFVWLIRSDWSSLTFDCLFLWMVPSLRPWPYLHFCLSLFFFATSWCFSTELVSPCLLYTMCCLDAYHCWRPLVMMPMISDRPLMFVSLVLMVSSHHGLYPLQCWLKLIGWRHGPCVFPILMAG